MMPFKKFSVLFLILYFHFRISQDGRKPHTIRLVIRRFSSEKYCCRESRQCPIPSHVIQKLGAGMDSFSKNLIDIEVFKKETFELEICSPKGGWVFVWS